MASKSSFTVGIDVGGTFTDLLAIDPATDEVKLAKVPTTVDNQAIGFMAALAAAGLDPALLQAVVHGTTTTTNAVLERKIAKVGLITTKGFRDVLELGRRTRPQPYGLRGTFTPVIDREVRLEVPERMDADGKVLTPLDEEAVADAARKLRAAGCEAVVIHFLHSYINPVHERRAAEIVRGQWPNDYVTAGHVILSEYREYERGVTAAVNASVQPVLDRYLSRLRTELKAKGFDRDLLVMQGNGGTISSQLIAEAAVNTVMSGPASGVMAAAYTGRASGHPNLITYDMGGTSTDVGLIEDAVPQVSGELELEYAMPIHVPMVDVHTIGAGGGSIASVDAAGMLRVGPESAGARPGPICYGRGGSEPTITDANLVLGRLNPDKLLGVDHPVTLDHVRGLVLEKVGQRLGLDAEAAAAAILRIANDRMAGAVRLVSLSRGHDPRDFALFAFGGAGPLHATALARELGIPTVLVPVRPGITNALGCVVADLRHDYVRTVNKPLSAVDDATVARIYAEQAAEGEATIAREGVPVRELRRVLSADMQFQGQSHILSVGVDSAEIGVAGLHKAFAAAYFRRFGIELPEIPPVLVNLHTAVIGVRPEISLAALAATDRAPTLAAAKLGTRRVWFSDGWHDTPVYAREKLPLDATLEGPAILEQLDCTTVVEPGDKVRQDRLGNLLISVG
ncbi:MAG: hydantoinase/oxoprolinase family protein [Reyranella sp.]|uniref:hydantoinase/oxoprolinase family protein n=1 Tax=Reyranella sp. TaxID=1929291 RepID=UPI001227B97A|nr:hydantoinase/oxoprolinase family protein [Reyranella sp.]TAJ91269.1 MAG: hydantoinase/oxoprolinase family protein [Reyranella sp.]TBR28979.1 MAG: hydantoinase/oxoprolinase family protein [Reyranella sp.]